MGYDMYWVNEMSPDESAAYSAAQAAFNQAVKNRDQHPRGSAETAAAQPAVDAAYEEMNRTRVSYFRLNIFGMRSYREVMDELGMVYESSSPEWPEPDNFGLTYDQVYAMDDAEESQPDSTAVGKWDSEEWANYTRYKEAHSAHLSAHSNDAPGIAIHKLCSNDGWIVTPDECNSALEVYARAFPRELSDEAKEIINATQEGGESSNYWNQWLAFLASSANHGGFRVY